MIHPLIIPVLVTTDLPPETDLAAFGQLLADAVVVLGPGSGEPYPGHLHGRTFWLDRPVPPVEPGVAPSPAEQLRFAATLGFLSAAVDRPDASVKTVIADARAAITAAVTACYGDLGSPPAVLAIRAEDVRERTPETAVVTVTADAAPQLARAAHARFQLV
ncbi:hypothetical protein ACFFMN_07210 [Planobispora siamensis]|uniref:Uncharacterized protein n=1 Tax=Planobispora siamensis TaxID=936338 RepID=A0A8J3WPB9_9ACTN|nr:hypothetical protein [Planobispora siamensis]GIH95477.1 hypothetical protein Psi01_61070 [Planobispora siamensis]